MVDSTQKAVLVIALVVGCSLAVASSARGEEPNDAQKEVQGVFRGEVEVSLVNLYVTVIDRDGKPVAGLNREDFEVFDNGELMEITNFAVIDHGKRVVSEVVDPQSGKTSRKTQTAEEQSRHVAILFDLPSLQRRNKRNVVDAVEGFVRHGLSEGDEFMVAANSGELRILQDFSSYEASLTATLEGVAGLEYGGSSVKGNKRLLKRTIHTTQFTRIQKAPFGGGVVIDEGYVRAQAGMLQTEVNNMRQYEYQRINQAISAADELVRALAGIDGPKTVVWIGEDLAMRPAYDLYKVFFKRASSYQNILHLSHPDTWGREMDLSRQFQRLAASAQSCGATFHVIDASDRDREMGSADYGSPGVDDVLKAQGAGNLWTPGTDITEFWDVTEGADYMALATGGTVQKNTRDLEGSVARIREQMVMSYSLGYQHPGAPDGKISHVQVKVKKPGLRVRHHEKVFYKTGNHHLADLALSRVRFDIGDNSLGLSLVEGQSQPGDEGKIVRAIQFRVPVESLVLMPESNAYAGVLVAAIAVLDGQGKTAEPRLMRLSITIPSERYQPDAIAARTLRLLMAPDTRRVAIGIRDEASGLTSTAALDLNSLEPTAETTESPKPTPDN